MPQLAAVLHDARPVSRNNIANAIAVMLLLFSTLYAGVFYLGISNSMIGVETRSETAATMDSVPAGEAIDAGRQLQQMGYRSTDMVVFVGDWRSKGIFWGNLGRVLVYSDMVVTGNKIQGMKRIHVAESEAVPGDCDYRIMKSEGHLSVSRCI